MTASSEVTVAPNGQGNVKLHPYLVALVRWCVSSLWSTITILLHRLKTAPLPIAGGPLAQKVKIPKRAAGTEHIHPEPKVNCQLLHQPEKHTLDVIFVHGLYGSLGNTWRQGDWRPKYQSDPKKVTLKNHTDKTCDCRNTKTTNHTAQHNQNKCSSSDSIYNITDLNDSEMTFTSINEKLFKKIIPKENDLITEQFYNNTLLDQLDIVDNYENQAKFVRDLFKRENDCDNDCDAKDNENKCKYNEINECKCSKECEVGCGCICDDCYSSCWPRDWIKMDFPGARVISINYTSDPYLWRPLWIKENKRLSLDTRAEQMMQQLLEMGVGKKPIIWVGHSKGGLFIKEIYCKAYESYKILNSNEETTPHEPKKVTDNIINRSNSNNDAYIAKTIDNIIGNMFDNQHFKVQNDTYSYTEHSDTSHGNLNEIYVKQDKVLTEDLNLYEQRDVNMYTEQSDTYNNSLKQDSVQINCISNDITNINVNDNESKCNDNLTFDNVYEQDNVEINGNSNDITNANVTENKSKITESNGRGNEAVASTIEEIRSQASLYSESRGFMFYSVPHRGSPLADIKTPVTARSLELLEITKDCPLVLDLQSRWLAAAAQGRRPIVRGFVETCRTLMAVLWLRIVSEDSADAGIGSLLGVSVDHREICKPSSRHCLLYTELMDLINEALECRC